MLEKAGLATVLLKSTAKEYLTHIFVKCVSLCCILTMRLASDILKCHMKALSTELDPQSRKPQEDGVFIAPGLLCVAI